jgi:hypothetical protein
LVGEPNLLVFLPNEPGFYQKINMEVLFCLK